MTVITFFTLNGRVFPNLELMTVIWVYLAIDIALFATLIWGLFTKDRISELLATYLLHNLKWELLGKTVLLPATVIYQARRAVPALNGCQSANINRLRLALMSRSWYSPQ